jgi:replicative DNA helicase
MAKKSEVNVLSEEFLAELYNCAINNDHLCSVVCQYMQDEFLPDRDYQMLNNALKDYYREHHMAPKFSIIKQMLVSSRAVSELLNEIKELASGADPDSIREQFERYLKLVQFKQIFKQIDEKFKSGDKMAAVSEFERQAQKLSQFSLAPDQFVDVAATFETRLRENKERHEEDNKLKAVTSFYIDALDEKNHGRNLRTQLSVFLAMSGVGKSHLARWIGANAAYTDGLDVLHFQLEGSASEVLDAYSASIVKTPTLEYESGRLNQHTIEAFQKQMENFAGTLKVKSYPKFGKEISTIDLKNACEEYKKAYGKYPDVVIVDSLDLLSDKSGKSWDSKSLRFKRIAVAEDLKDLAADINAWVVATYQATIEDPEWVNNEKNVLNGYNLSEAKGLQRPVTHLISLNQSTREEKEQTMRLYVAKSRFFKKGDPFRICTDYEHECFYDRTRTLNLPKED